MSARQRNGRKAAAVSGVLLALLVATASASAGQWMQVSCVNPDGSRAPSEGWSGFSAGAGFGSNNTVGCAPGAPMFAMLSNQAAVGVGAHETLQYTPPRGSVLDGGTINVSLFADGGGTNASGTAIVYTPSFAYDASDVVFQCAWGLGSCGGPAHDFDGTLALPSNRGGELFVGAGCGGAAGYSCNTEGSEGAWALARVRWADLLLFSDANPSAGGFGGTLLGPDAAGVADVTFTASDPEGPGVYAVELEIDGKPVYRGTPETNGGKCIPVGKSGSALMFDYSQPCRPSLSVDLPVDTRTLSDGAHSLKIVVEDAAGNASTVYSGAISTRNALAETQPIREDAPHPTAPGQGAVIAPGLPGQPNGTGASVGAQLHIEGKHAIKRSYATSALAVNGELLDSEGRAIGGAQLVVLERMSGASTAKVVGSVATMSSGHFVAHLPKGGSRLLTIAYRAFSGDSRYSAQATIAETVRAVELRIAPGHTSSTGTITMKVHVAGPVPRQGVLVLVMVHYHGAWLPVRRVRSDSAGNGTAVYTFHSSVGKFPFFAEVPGYQADYLPGRERSRTVFVRTG